MTDIPTIPDFLRTATRSVCHLELRDQYGVAAENEKFMAWKAGHRDDPADRPSWWRPWLDLIVEITARGVEVRRARIFSEPMSDYIRFEYDGTFANVSAGEQVRWLPRHETSDFFLPPNDFWVVDRKCLLWNYFDGEGRPTFKAIERDPEFLEEIQLAFEGVWERATPHEHYKLA